MARRPVIAIDGPAASGKSSTARAVARALGYAHVDSGALYRACTLVALDDVGGDPAAWTPEAIVAQATARGLAVRADAGAFEVSLDGGNVEPAIRADRVTREVSRVAAMGPVRDYVNGLLREAARGGGVVMDGRDIGTVVFPDAEVKVYMLADPRERARRRLAEKGTTPDERAVAREAEALQARDAYDSARDVAPLAQAAGALVVDTTRLGFDEQVALVVDLARRAAAG